jgi:hypothetical protein
MQANRLVNTLTIARAPGVPRSPRRVRTASPKWIEFFLVFDVLYAPLVALPLTALVGVGRLSAAGLCVAFVAIAMAAFVVFWLALVNCNPYPPGYTVFDQLQSIPNAMRAVPITRTSDLSALSYPVIFKPSLCSTNSSGVMLVKSIEEARQYLRWTAEDVVCAQEFHSGEEFTIMWERWPWRRRGAVKGVYWRKKLHARGEFHPLSGRNTPKVTVDARHLRTPALVRAVEASVARMKNLHCTRFDVRAESAEALARGEFFVLESNGTIGVPGGSIAYAIAVAWPRRILTGLYNLFTHEDASAHPRVLVRRVQRFLECGGWDFRICDGF